MSLNNDKSTRNFKFKSLKTFAWDRVMNHHRKYRTVFDRKEINYLSVALELYNKRFDEKDWDIEITYKAYGLEGEDKKNEICSEVKKHTVSSEESEVLFDFGWGNEEYGKFWRQGAYQWEVYIDGDLLETCRFHIEEAGPVTDAENPYFKVASLRTYEAPKGDLAEDERIYLKQFGKKETRYIMSEIKLINLLEEEWLCELFFNYYDDTGLLVGVADNIGYITPHIGSGESYTISAGWGSAGGDSWLMDNYRVEVVFMDHVVAMIPFSVGEKAIERVSDYEALINEEVDEFYGKHQVKDMPSKETGREEKDSPSGDKKTDKKPEETEIQIDDRPLNEILAELDALVGLKDIKQKVREYVDYISYLQYREEKGLENKEDISLHSVFTGNPGTGKTTVAKLLGKIYASIGLLSKGHVHTVESNDLISGYVRQTGEETKKAIEKARGGILFIDEAYMLYKDGAPNDFGPEAVAALITEMSDGPGDIAVMVAGYPAEMERFIHSNPGLKSRFRNYYHFEDYSPDELIDIAGYAADKKDVELSEDALEELKKIVTSAFRSRDKTFGNARLVHSLVDEAKMNLGIRVVRNYAPEEITKEMLRMVRAEDIEDPSTAALDQRLRLDLDKALLDEALEELDTLTGLDNIKQEVQDLIRLTRYYREIDRDVLKAFSMHSVFMGNPGTGKTTVARILGKVFKALGLLERGHLVDADASDLVAGFVGQTAGKTKDVIKKAMGGVLFIDEAYAITDGSNRGGADFGKEAVAALIKEMEDHRGEFAVIVAGYPENMGRFIQANPGIKSRFDRTFIFQDFKEDELWDIALSMFAREGVKPDREAESHVKKYIAHLYATRNKFFGNARSIRKMVEKAFRNHELRMADLPKAKRTKALMETITMADVKEFDEAVLSLSAGRKGIGFKFGE